MSRKAKPAKSAAAIPPGFLIKDQKDFGKKLAASLAKCLDFDRLNPVLINLARGESHRIATIPAQPRDENGRFPVLPLREPTSSNGAWIEIAIDYDRTSGQCFATHVSLKTFLGASAPTAMLRFRAEWDHRSEAKPHAQPHWNIDEPAKAEVERTTSVSAAPWVPASTAAPWITQQEVPEVVEEEPVPELNLDISHFHFAMSAIWQSTKPNHSATISTEDELIQWVTGCATYIKEQLHTRRMAYSSTSSSS